MLNRALVIRWLLGNSGTLRKIVEIAVKWGSADSLAVRLQILSEIINELAPIVDTFPAFASQAVALSENDFEEDLVHVQAMGIATPVFLNVLLPIIMEIIRLLTKRDEG